MKGSGVPRTDNPFIDTDKSVGDPSNLTYYVQAFVSGDLTKGQLIGVVAGRGALKGIPGWSEERISDHLMAEVSMSTSQFLDDVVRRSKQAGSNEALYRQAAMLLIGVPRSSLT